MLPGGDKENTQFSNNEYFTKWFPENQKVHLYSTEIISDDPFITLIPHFQNLSFYEKQTTLFTGF